MQLSTVEVSLGIFIAVLNNSVRIGISEAVQRDYNSPV